MSKSMLIATSLAAALSMAPAHAAEAQPYELSGSPPGPNDLSLIAGTIVCIAGEGWIPTWNPTGPHDSWRTGLYSTVVRAARNALDIGDDASARNVLSYAGTRGCVRIKGNVAITIFSRNVTGDLIRFQIVSDKSPKATYETDAKAVCFPTSSNIACPGYELRGELEKIAPRATR